VYAHPQEYQSPKRAAVDPTAALPPSTPPSYRCSGDSDSGAGLRGVRLDDDDWWLLKRSAAGVRPLATRSHR
jgi:hypothetical protein